MIIHLDSQKFNTKPTGSEIAQIKASFTAPESIVNLNAEQIAAALISGQTIQPGVCPFSERSRAAGTKGTVQDDFCEQTLFMIDIDNKRDDIPLETPAHVAETLAANNLKAAFMYDTFSSSHGAERFRVAIVSEQKFTYKKERDDVQQGLVALFPQADASCVNADRMFLGTNRGLINEYTDYTAVCGKAMLLSLANEPKAQDYEKTAVLSRVRPIPIGQRHNTLLSFASTVLKRSGENEQAYDAFIRKAALCEEPLPENEIDAIWRDACTFFRTTILTDPGYLLPEDYAAEQPSETYEPRDYTDVGQANVFTAEYGKIVKFTPATGFIVYNGQTWQESETKAQLLSQKLTEKQLEEVEAWQRRVLVLSQIALQSGIKTQDEQVKVEKSRMERYQSYVLSRRKSERVKATLTEARPKCEINITQLDADGYLLNTPAGAVDLRTGAIRPHSPEDYCTKITAVAPDTVNSEMFAEFLERITMNNKDEQSFLQETAGMCAVGKVFRENLIMAYGEGGNGKSTFFNLLSRVLGDYSGVLSSETLTANCRKNKSPEFADLRGKRIVIAAELEEGALLDTGTLKKLCSVDAIKAEKKYKDPFEFIPSHTLILYTNHLPKIGTTDKGTWDRIVIVPFLANLRGMKGEIKNYADHLFTHCGGAVLTWIIEGAKRFIANGHNIVLPECVIQAIDQYKNNNDWLRDFLDECCIVESNCTEKSGKLHSCYSRYCDRVGIPRIAPSDFKKALNVAGFETRKTKNGVIVYGLKIADESSAEPF